MPIAHDFSLDAKYRQEDGTIFLSGIQALVRLPLDQHRADRRRGLNTATLISGYRGSPLGGFDLTLERNPQAAQRAQRRVHLRRQRGPRRHRRVRQPARQLLPAGQVRRRARRLVRQGPRRRPHRRHLQARELRRRRPARRRAGAGRRRSALEVLDAADALRGRLLRRAVPGAVPGQRAGDPRPRAARLRAVALLGAVGRLQDRDERRRRDRHRRGRPRPHRDRRPRLPVRGQAVAATPRTRCCCRPTASTWSARSTTAGWRRPRSSPPPTGSTGSRSTRRTPGSASPPPARPTTTCARRWRELGLDEAALRHHGIRLLKVGMLFPMEPGIVRHFARGLEEILVVEEKRSFVELFVRDVLYNDADPPARDRQARRAGAAAGARPRRAGRRPHRPDRGHPAGEAPAARVDHRARRRCWRRCASARPRSRWPASRTSARAARTTARPWCRRAPRPRPASAATAWP